MSYSIIAQQAFTDREVRCEETRVRKEREVYLGRKEKLYLGSLSVISLRKRRAWSGLREPACDVPSKLLKADIKCAWQLTQSHLIFTPTLKGSYYHLNFTGEGILVQKIEMTNKRYNVKFDSTFSDSNKPIHVLP